MSVEQMEAFFKENGELIFEKIRQRKYKPLPVRRVAIPKPDGSKRPLGIPSVKDRVLQQAITQVISPMCENVFSEKTEAVKRLFLKLSNTSMTAMTG